MVIAAHETRAIHHETLFNIQRVKMTPGGNEFSCVILYMNILDLVSVTGIMHGP